MNADCPCRTVFEHLTSRWSLLVLVALGDGRLRFHALRDRVEGVSEKMLSQSLRTLVRDGMVSRHVEPTIPPRVSYELTPLGKEVSMPMRAISDWIGNRMTDIRAAQERFDAGRM
ncbi:helix-turn-helix domain-containing protein [Aquamicrobium sp. LC103]|uniref:winged helix-turn-helix transcriptional regulator n=1 Tax=Aquamicrobium sp. LC103 TaxID=1120658 RepID=UPI00063E829F|nr:helix-turn-helix domain-containing protein [Aquamicrobium sp. LC103]TKT81286.1 helix-turn-helix transcriptional regulator [Aquamicrobium sp. LC103]